MRHLESGRPTEAGPLLADVDAALAGEPELADIRARVLSLRAQVALETGDAAEARRHAAESMRLLRAAGDGEGLASVRDLDAKAAAELDKVKRASLARARSSELAALTADDLLARTDDALARADALIRHAGALRAHGDVSGSLRSARLAVAEADRAGAVRERVLARLAAFEAEPEPDVLLGALAIADAADEPTLIALVARAAELAGLPLPKDPGAHGRMIP